jgi:hypothetical protein
VQPGAATVFPRNNVEKLGNVIAVGASAAEAEANARRARFRVVFDYECRPETDAFLAGQGPEPWWFPQARGLNDAEGDVWLERGRLWRDAYGDPLSDLVDALEKEGRRPLERGPRFWRALLVGGMNGARYAEDL